MKKTNSYRCKRWFFARSMARAYRDWLEKRTGSKNRGGSRSGSKAVKANKRPLFAEALEPRVLFSATPAPVESDLPEDNASPQEATAQISELTDIEEIGGFSFEDGIEADFSEADLERLANEAVARWEKSGLTEDQVEALESINYVVSDLEGAVIGAAEGNTVYLDFDAAGRDWFVDNTEWLDEEFVEIDGILRAAGGDDIDGLAAEGMDLLSIIMHEQGHVLGLDHVEDSISGSVMYDSFEEGERRLLTVGEAEGATLGSLEGAHYATVNATWSGSGDGTSWNDGANWSGTAPSNFGTLEIDTAATIDNVYLDGGATTLYTGASTFRGTVNLNQGTIEIDHYFGTGPLGGGFNIGDGSGTADAIVNVVDGGTWELDRHASGTYTVNINSDGELNATGTGKFQTYSNTNTRQWEINVNGGILTSVADWNMRGNGNDHNKITISNGGSVNVGAITVTSTVIDFLDADVGSTFTAKYGGSFADIAAVNAAIGTTFIGSNGNPLVANDNGDGTFTLNALFKATVSIVANDPTATENGDGGQFTVIMTEANDIDTTLTYNVTGTAASGTDFSALSGTVTIDAGQTTATIDLSTVDNGIVEASETVIVTLVSVTAGNTGGRVVTIDSSNPGGVGNVVADLDFTGADLASAGMAASLGAAGGSWTLDDPSDRVIGVGGGNARASVYTIDSWQNDEGFTLDVTFWGSSALVRHSFGIVDADFNIAGTSSDWLNQSLAGAYGIGFSTAGSNGTTDYLGFNKDAGTATVLSTAQGNKTSAASETMSITVTADSWSYSLNGQPATTGTFSTPFDTSREYRFIAYGQRASRASFASITLTEVPGAEVTIVDNDIDIAIAADQTSVDEGNSGTTDYTFTVTRDGRTDGTSTVDWALSGDLDAADFGGVIPSGMVTFAPGSTSETITVSVTGDGDVESDENFTVTLSNAADSVGTNQIEIETATANSTVANDDIATVSITANDATATENGDAGQYTVTMTEANDVDTTFTYNVTGTAASGTDFSALTGTVTIDAGQTTATIDLTTVNNDIFEASETVIVTLTGVTAGNTGGRDVTIDSTPGANTATVTIADDDTVGFTLSKTTATVSEDGTTTTDSFTVVLDSEPTSNVVLSITNPDTGEVTADAAALTFTSGNWNIAQTVNLTGADDNLIDGDQTTTLTISVVDASSDDAFDTLVDQTVVVTTTDDDTAGFTLSKTTATVSEDGTTTTDSFTVVLDAEPTSDVVISITNPDTGEVTSDAAALTFTSGNWNVAQTVNLTGADDPSVDGDQITTLTLAVDDANSDDAFDALADQTVVVTTTDDDGTLITQTTGVTSNGTTLRVRDINGEDTADNLVISVDGTDLVVKDIAGNEIGTDVASGSTVVGISEIRFALNSFTNLKIEANGNDDLVSIGDLTGVLGSVTVLGGDGFDTITLTGTSDLASDANASFTGEHIQGDTITFTTSGTGTIDLTGSGGNASAGAGSFHGVFLRESALTSDTGDITITGSGSDGSIFNDGVQLMQTNVSTTDASITITGTGSGGIRSKGVNLLAFPGGTVGSDITAGGSGNLTIVGVGGTGSFQNEGVSINNNSVLRVVDGDISITGTGGAGSFGGVGVKFTSGVLLGSGDGNVTLTGTSAATGGFFNGGLELKATTISTTGDGAGSGLVTITGTGSSNGTLLNDGVKLLTNTSIIAGENASIDIDGTSTGTTVGNNGVFMTATVYLSVTGTGGINIDGTGSALGSVNNDGVFLGQTDLNFENGDVNINGTGGTGSQGVQMVTAIVGGTGSGNINIVGSSVGTKGINQGISLSLSTLTTAGGSGDITLKGTGSANGSFSNDGIILSASEISTGSNASIDLEGVGGGSVLASGFFNNGIQLKANSSLHADGAGEVRIDGTGGVAALLNRGIWIQSGSDVSSGTGNIIMNGTGNGSTLFNQGIFLSAGDVTTAGDITLKGTGSQTASSVFNTGVSIGGSSGNTIGAGGTLTITGTGGTGSTLNEGVRVLNVKLSGNLQVLGISNANTTSGVLNSGVYMLGVNLGGAYASSSITGFGGGLTSGVGNLHHGIYMNGIVGGFAGSTTGTTGFGALSKDKTGNFFL